MYRLPICALLMLLLGVDTLCQDRTEQVISDIAFRNIGPAYMSGRISDVVKDPTDPSTWYVAVASGNVWKTTNNATSWKPIFDNQTVYSTGCLAIDPNNPNVIWLGTGENQSQRSVGWGDGVYRSLDAGKTWSNMGLKESEHIGKIHIDPDNSDVIIVAAQGPLWKEGGDRGVFKSVDGGISWKKTLDVGENTGASEVVVDPNNSNIIYATTYQRRRHVGILVAGGPESRIYKSTDQGETWKMLQRGLPGGDLGRIAVAVSPQKSNVVYAHISGADGSNGFYRSSDYGESWKKMNDYAIVDPQYYGEIYCDPHRFDVVYVMDVVVRYTEDGGTSFQRLNTRYKHVDNHSLLFDKDDENYLMMGCDGGIYESWDRGEHWFYHSNLPITQFYRVGIDNEKPFYNVFGGTQDNSTLMGPSQTTSRQGITNDDWTLVLGGDGFQARVDPDNSNIVYAQYQYAGLVRYDKQTGQRTELQPQISDQEEPLRWHWDSPLLISHYDSKRLYFAAQKIFRSDDRGDSWYPISGDLSRNEDRNEREVMGKIWPPEAVWKNVFTSPYGTIVSLSESSVQEGLMVAGTDDGLLQITTDGGANWKTIDNFAGVPEKSYVADVLTSQHEANRIYVVFNNHKEGDFASYIMKSDDLGDSWQMITNGISEKQSSWTILEDHVDPELLFAGTEMGLWCSVDRGENWFPMKGKIPTIAIRDMEIHKEENDLILASFGRGFYILDDYSPLRQLKSPSQDDVVLFDIADVQVYHVMGNRGYSEKGVFGENFYTAPNPPSGVIARIYLPEKIKSLKEQRKENDDPKDASYPPYERLKEEDFERDAQLFLRVQDENGSMITHIPIANRKGFQEVNGELRKMHYSDDREISRLGPRLLSGKLTAQVFLIKDGELKELSDAKPFNANRLDLTNEQPAEDYYSFYTEVTNTVIEAQTFRSELRKKLEWLNKTLSSNSDVSDSEKVKDLEDARTALKQMQYDLEGDQTRRKRFQYFHPGVIQRLNRVYGNQYQSFQTTGTHRESYKVATSKLETMKQKFTELSQKIAGY